MSYLWHFYHLNTSRHDDAVSKVEKYRKLLREVKEHVSIAKHEQEKIIACMFNANETMMAHNSGTEGHGVSFYSDKVDQWKEERRAYWNRLQEEFVESNKRIITIQNLIGEWENTRDSEARSLDEQVARIQERERREYEAKLKAYGVKI